MPSRFMLQILCMILKGNNTHADYFRNYIIAAQSAKKHMLSCSGIEIETEQENCYCVSIIM
jgi:hypothetical protein